MLLLGMVFITIGLIFILSQVYTIKKENGERIILRRKVNMGTWFTRYKILMGILSIVLGLFSILNHILY